MFILARYYSPESLGYYSLAMSVLSLPAQMIGLSISKVFFQNSSMGYESGDLTQLKKKVVKVFYGSLLLSIIPFGVLFSFSELIFVWLAGPSWKMAGTFAKYLALGGVIQFSWTSISSILKTLRRERLQFWMEVSSSLVMIVALLIVALGGYPLLDFIFVLGVLLVVRYWINCLVVFQMLRNSLMKHTFLSFLLIVIFFLFFYTLRLLTPL